MSRSRKLWITARTSVLQASGDWRLPQIGELSGLYDPTVTQRATLTTTDIEVHIRAGIQLTGTVAWNSTPGDVFGFSTGTQFSASRFDNPYGIRALCVRYDLAARTPSQNTPEPAQQPPPSPRPVDASAFVGKWYSTTFKGFLEINRQKGGILTAKGNHLYGGLYGDYSDVHVTGNQLQFTNGVSTFLGYIDKGEFRVVYGPSDFEADFVRDEKIANAMRKENNREDPAEAAARRAQTIAAIMGVATDTMQTINDNAARNAEIRQQAEQQRAAQAAQQHEALNEEVSRTACAGAGGSAGPAAASVGPACQRSTRDGATVAGSGCRQPKGRRSNCTAKSPAASPFAAAEFGTANPGTAPEPAAARATTTGTTESASRANSASAFRPYHCRHPAPRSQRDR